VFKNNGQSGSAMVHLFGPTPNMLPILFHFSHAHQLRNPTLDFEGVSDSRTIELFSGTTSATMTCQYGITYSLQRLQLRAAVLVAREFLDKFRKNFGKYPILLATLN
jgi:hypothetical protein